MRGSLLLDLGRADEAQAIYEKLLAGKLDARLKFLAHEGLGYALERKGKLAEAQATFAKLGDDAAAPGRLLQGSGPLPRSAARRAARQPGGGRADLSRGAGQEPDHLVARRDLEPPRAARAEVSPASGSVPSALAIACRRGGVRLRDGAAPGRLGERRAHRAGHPADRVADDAARARPVRAVARGVRVRRAGRGPPGARLARRRRGRRRARHRPPRLGRPACPAASTARRASMPRAARSTWAPTTAASTRSIPRPARFAGRTGARARSSARPRSAPTWSTSAAPPIASSRWSRRPASGAGSTSATCPRGSRSTATRAPRLRGAQLLVGFADGYFVSLAAASGEVMWAKSLAAASDQFVDVDSTPARSPATSTYVVLVFGRALRARPARRQRALAPGNRGRRRRHGGRRAPVLRRARATGCTPRTPTATCCGARG